MYKYLLFGFANHYPMGGMDDLILKFNSYDEVEKEFSYELHYDEYQLVDTTDFSHKTFRSKITWHIDRDEPNEIKEKREKEFLNWLKENLQNTHFIRK